MLSKHQLGSRKVNLEFRGDAWTADRHLVIVSLKWLPEMQNQQRLTGEGVYSEEKRVAPTMNSWMEDGGPGKEARDCLESQRETRS